MSVVRLVRLDDLRVEAAIDVRPRDVRLEAVERVAADQGRLLRQLRDSYGRLPADSYALFLAERVAEGLLLLDVLLAPTAGELVADGLQVDEALAETDERDRLARQRLGLEREAA